MSDYMRSVRSKLGSQLLERVSEVWFTRLDRVVLSAIALRLVVASASDWLGR